jgi:uncharacterized membrane protein
MTNEKAFRPDGLGLAALAAALVVLAFAVIEAPAPFWYDEVFTLGAAGVFPDLDWLNIRRDVHPPGYLILASLGRALLGGDPLGARLVNLLALAVAAAAAWRLARVLGRDRMLIVLTLLLASRYTPFFVAEARSYLLLMALCLLGHALILRPMGRGAALGLSLTAIALSGLHFFGTAIAGGLILTALGRHLRNGGDAGITAVLVAGGALALTISVGWIAVFSDFRDNLGGSFHITNDPRLLMDFPLQLVPASASAWSASGRCSSSDQKRPCRR